MQQSLKICNLKKYDTLNVTNSKHSDSFCNRSIKVRTMEELQYETNETDQTMSDSNEDQFPLPE